MIVVEIRVGFVLFEIKGWSLYEEMLGWILGVWHYNSELIV